MMWQGAIAYLWRACFVLCAFTLSFTVLPQTRQLVNSRADFAEHCVALSASDLSTVQDAPAQITSAVVKGAEGETPGYCEVDGYVWRNVRFKVRFPAAWNGKMVVMGAGGQAGHFADSSLDGRSGYSQIEDRGNLLRKGYAFMLHDSGHVSTPFDSKWGYNNEVAMIDYGFRAAHVAAVIGKEILNRYFGHPPAESYYHSCSNGGREALMMAQRYPWDYDGLIAGAPSLAYSDLFIHWYWMSELLNDRSRDGFDDIAAGALHRSVLQQCGSLDLYRDGVLQDPLACKVDLTKIECKHGPAEDCLTPHQAEVARKIYEGPRNSEGQQIAPSSAMPGSELNWASWVQPNSYPNEVFRYLAFDPPPGPSWKPDLREVGNYAKRMGLMDALFSAQNPDLRKFKANGGKLLIYYGWNDPGGGAREAMDYYDTVERVMGGAEKTKQFLRLFMIPGMDHCFGGQGASVFDFLGVVDKWVERGQRPDVLIGYHPNPDGSPKFTRRVLPYESGRPH